ncbi:MAG: TrkH family potassium uptake protein [Phycisphaera sp.]|nr:TrkH family potassium uptake protein [Phycisphaera sp.]
MNYRFIINQLGLLLIVLSAVMGAVVLWVLADWLLGNASELQAVEALLTAAGIGLLSGGVMWYVGRKARSDTFGRRDALFLVAISWMVGAGLSALPFFLWVVFHPSVDSSHPFGNYVACYFESMSGLTTTGATVLSGDKPYDIESLPRGLLLWRALTHWLGGLGIVVLFVAVLPSLGVGAKKLFHTESSGITPSGVRPRIAETARILWIIYVVLTVAQIVLLRLCGMGWFDSACHTFATVATGGFSTYNASTGNPAINTPALIVIIFFMILAGANFGLYFHVLRGSIGSIFKDTEFRFYLVILAVASLIVTGSLLMNQPEITITNADVVETGVGNSALHGAFQVVSIQTTTGFATADFNQWPFLAKAVIVAVMFIGGCAGSTAGGIKVVRLWVMMKVLWAELEHVFNPNVIRPLRVGNTTVDNSLKLAVLGYVLGMALLVFGGSIVVMMLEHGNPRCDYTTAATASVATLCTIGPGLNAIGATENYGWMSTPTMAFLSILMAFGRLEIFALFVLVHPRFWMKD